VTSGTQLADLEGASRVSIGGLSVGEAVTLLAKIAGAHRVEAEPAAAAAIAAACGGLPLALRIVGARLAASPALHLADLAAALCDNGKLLGELVIGDLSVRRRLDATWRGLDPTCREALRTLATLAEGGLGVLPSSLVRAATDGAPAAARTLADSCLIIQIPETGDYRMAPLAACHAVAQPAS
jgi:hypothetical protein